MIEPHLFHEWHGMADASERSPISRENPLVERMSKIVTPEWTIRLWRRKPEDPITAVMEKEQIAGCLIAAGRTADAEKAAEAFFPLPTLTAVEVTDPHGNGVVKYVEPFAD